MHTTITYFITFTFCIHFCVCKNYVNYTLFRGIPVEEGHLDYFMNLSRTSGFNFWREPGILYKPVEFVVDPKNKPVFLVEAERQGLYLTTILEDVQEAFDKQTVKAYIRRNMNSFDWNNFFRLDDIYKWLSDLAETNPTEVSVQSIGRTEAKREIMAVRIVMRGCKMRSTVIVEGGIHAREWISPAFVTYLIHEIIHSRTSGNQQLQKIALTYEWFFVPVLNPDGYEFSHTNDRLWRKNCNGNGVDLNRNFDHAFGKRASIDHQACLWKYYTHRQAWRSMLVPSLYENRPLPSSGMIIAVGVSNFQLSDTYCGPSAFSEKETKAMRNFVASKSANLEYYLAFHSYGQYLIIPYADSKKHMQNFDEVKSMCVQAGQKIATRYRTTYSTGTAYDTVGYTTSGVSSCWVKKTYQVPYVVTFELRDGGFYGFALPVHKILPTCRETMDGIISLLTPKSLKYSKLRQKYGDSGSPQFILDKIVIVFNVLLFIIVRFD